MMVPTRSSTNPFDAEVLGPTVEAPLPRVLERVSREETEPAPAEPEEAVEEFDIPEDAYGAATLVIVRDLQEVAAGRDVCLNLVTTVSSLSLNALNLTLQFLIVGYLDLYVVGPKVNRVQTLYRDYHAEVFDANGQFQEQQWHGFSRQLAICEIAVTNEGFYITSLFLWWTSMMKELRTTWRLFLNISSMPQCSGGSNMLKVFNDKADHFEEAVEVAVSQVHIVALTACARWCLYLFVCLPKFLICIALLWLGSQWLSATNKFEDLIMNAVAMTFVTQIDEMLYDVLLPAKFREEVSATNFVVPEQRRSAQEVRNREIRLGFARSAVYLAIIIGGILLYSQVFQDVLPHNVRDLREHCATFMRNVTPICTETLLHRVTSIVQTDTYTNRCYPYGPKSSG